jgi:hypothetical protein
MYIYYCFEVLYILNKASADGPRQRAAVFTRPSPPTRAGPAGLAQVGEETRRRCSRIERHGLNQTGTPFIWHDEWGFAMALSFTKPTCPLPGPKLLKPGTEGGGFPSPLCFHRFILFLLLSGKECYTPPTTHYPLDAPYEARRVGS